MPLYEFQCSDCHKQNEILIRSSQEQPECPDCGSQKLERQLSVAAAPTIQGKGLPVAAPNNCGRPQCASGRCMFE